jgi:hypothetical protein
MTLLKDISKTIYSHTTLVQTPNTTALEERLMMDGALVVLGFKTILSNPYSLNP